jgi:4-amino-4-deoxy-L-arabinose transferase-like glycosyltransferase
LAKSFQIKPVFRKYGLLGSILFSGLLIRLWGISWGLPFLYHPDEVQVVTAYLKMVKGLNLNPQYFIYPGFSMYLNAFVYGLYYMVQRRLGNFQGLSDIAIPRLVTMATGSIADPNVYYLGRAISILFGLGTIYLSYRCAKEVSQKPLVGLLAAAFTAVSNANIVQSRLILPNIFVAFFVILSVWFSLRLYRTGKLRDYILAGLAVGLTAAAKYNGGAIIIVPICAHFLRMGLAGWKMFKPLLFFFFFTGLGYILFNPYDLLDFNNFWRQFIIARNSYADGWLGFSDNPFTWYLSYLWRMEGLVAVAALGGIVFGLIKRRPQIIITGLFPLVYFLFLSSFRYYNEHTILHMLPAMHVTGAAAIGMLVQKGLERFPARRLAVTAAAGLLILIALAIPLWQSIQVAIQTNTPNSRETSRVWINANLPARATIAIEPYSPFVDNQKFKVVGVALPHDISWYRQRKVDYLVFSQGMYKRFYLRPDIYGDKIRVYEDLFQQLDLVKRFNDGDYEILVYQMKE